MPDHAVSSNPAVQAQLDRLSALGPGADILGLERVTALLAKLGNPHLALPPVFHVAGTNGKGSTCAFLRAALEADGKSVHVFTSPHLVRFNERIRINGALISDSALAGYLERVLDRADRIGASFFEVTTAAMFLAFAEASADACILEVGLGGRLDATNVVPSPVMGGVAQLGIDHQAFLGDSLAEIAAEKAGIAKPGAPIVSQRYSEAIADVVERTIAARGGLWRPMGSSWDAAVYRGRLHYRDADGKLDMPLPRLSGPHQPINAALATAMLRHQQAVPVGESALKAMPLWAQWPARLQRMDVGPLLACLSPEATVWLDGGHNASAGEVLGQYFDPERLDGKRLQLVIGMLANKDIDAFMDPLRGKIAAIHALPIDGHACHPPERFAEIAGRWGVPFAAHFGPEDALEAIARDDPAPLILIAGSLYLAGTVLHLNGQYPD